MGTAGCNNRMPMTIGSFSYTRSGLVSLARSQFCRSSDVTRSDLLKGNSEFTLTNTPETLGLAELLRLIKRDVLKRG